MKHLIYIIISLIISLKGYSQKLNNIQFSLGYRNPYGIISIAYSRKVIINKFDLEFALGGGFNNCFSYGTGISVGYNVSKRWEILVTSDFIGNLKGKRIWDYKGYRDKYSFTERYYFCPHLDGRFNFKNDNSIELKLGYSFLLNNVKIRHLYGPNKNYKYAKRTINSGIIIGIGFNFGI